MSSWAGQRCGSAACVYQLPHCASCSAPSLMQAKPGGAPGSAAKPGASQPTPSHGATASQQPSQGGAASQQPAASGAEATGKREKGYAELFPKDSTNVVRWVGDGRWAVAMLFGRRAVQGRCQSVTWHATQLLDGCRDEVCKPVHSTPRL